jgi:hypothetical protein
MNYDMPAFAVVINRDSLGNRSSQVVSTLIREFEIVMQYQECSPMLGTAPPDDPSGRLR